MTGVQTCALPIWGVLFLDELPEFSHTSLESLRQPLEDKVVTISRVSGTVTYPASFMLVSAMNPCPCGFFSDPKKECTCSSSAVTRYQKRVSGPLLERIDVFVEVPPVEYERLVDEAGLRLQPRPAKGGAGPGDSAGAVQGQRVPVQLGDGPRGSLEIVPPR